MGLSRYLLFAVIACAVLAATGLIPSPRVKKAKRHMQDPQQAKAEKIREIYARAKKRIDALREERRAIIDDYEKKVNEHRIAQAKKRIDEI